MEIEGIDSTIVLQSKSFSCRAKKLISLMYELVQQQVYASAIPILCEVAYNREIAFMVRL